MKIAVIGGGIFGCTCAWMLAKEGHEVDLYEKNSDIFTAASGINQFRLHRGYHYPRSKETIISCLEGEKKFRELYGDCVIDEPHKHYYGIAKEKSFLDAKGCFKIWQECGLEFKQVNEVDSIINKNAFEAIVKVKEAIIDPYKFKKNCKDRLIKYGVKTFFNKEVTYNKLKDSYDFIIVSTYASLNKSLEGAQEAHKSYQFELIEKLVFEFPDKYKNLSFVVQDGPFTCIDPYGMTGLTLMGNVTHAIHKRKIGNNIIIPNEFKDLVDNGIIKNPPISKRQQFLDSAELFFPNIKKDAKYVGSMFTVRTVLPFREHDDARPTVVEVINDKLLKVFSGKIPTCVDVGIEVVEIAKEREKKLQQKSKKLNIGLIGIGKWGNNLFRVFNQNTNLVICSTKTNKEKLKEIDEIYPSIKTTLNYREVINDKNVEAVVISTPIDTHYSIAKEALLANKHVFIEKPSCKYSGELKELEEISKSKGLILFIGYTFLYHPIYKKIQKLIKNDSVKRIEAYWAKFGTFKEQLTYNLLSHELSLLISLLDYSSIKKRRIVENQSIMTNLDILGLELNFENGTNAKINLNRISPRKTKTLSILTQKDRLLHWQDNTLFELDKKEGYYKVIFKDTTTEPLDLECNAFIKCVEEKIQPLSNSKLDLKIINFINDLENNYL